MTAATTTTQMLHRFVREITQLIWHNEYAKIKTQNIRTIFYYKMDNKETLLITMKPSRCRFGDLFLYLYFPQTHRKTTGMSATSPTWCGLTSRRLGLRSTIVPPTEGTTSPSARTAATCKASGVTTSTVLGTGKATLARLPATHARNHQDQSRSITK